MILWLLTAPLTALLGYLYPAYVTYKAVEKRKPDIDELLFWGKYWILVGAINAFETLFFGLVTWIPFYTVARLLLLVYMWHPRTQGVLLLYHRGVQPVVMKHEQRIDQNLQELQTRGSDLAVEHARNLVGSLQSVLSQGGSIVKNQYQSFNKRSPAPYGGAPPAAGYAPNPYPPTGGGEAVAGGPDSMYNLRARKGYES